MKHRRPPTPHWDKGQGFCRWCGDACLPRRQWHDECVKDFKLAAHSDEQRRQVFDRDHGICAACGCDSESVKRANCETERLWRWLARRHYNDLMWSERKISSCGECHDLACRSVEQQVERAGFNNREAAWNADHIRPLLEGAGQDLEYFKLANLQTLCCRCHKAKSKREASERASKRAAGLLPPIKPSRRGRGAMPSREQIFALLLEPNDPRITATGGGNLE